MKILLPLFLLLSFNFAYSQNDSIPCGVYSFNKAKPEKTATGEKRFILQGTSLDLASLNVHASTLLPGTTNHPPVAYNDREELLVVKDGILTVMLNDSVKKLESGSVVLMEAGLMQSFKNETSSAVTYFILTFKSRPGIDAERGKKGGGSVTRNWSALQVIKTDKGESRPMFVKPSAMFAKFDMHATALNPGFASHAPHTHRNEEIILMLKGKAESYIDGKKYQLEAGDIVFTAANAAHNITNTGTEQCGYFAIQWGN